MATGTAVVGKANPLVALAEYGQSVWLDFIRRSIITTGELHRMVQEDGLRGVTSNPAIFEKAIAGSTDYTTAFEALQAREDLDAMGLYEELAIRDIQDAADVMRPVYDKTNRCDGYVSLEVSPYLARKTQESITEARRLWKAVARPNVMIKIPGTTEGVPAIEQLISEGINVNVTLLFSMQAYERVAQAYISGIEKFVKGGGDPSKVASVASFFISRIDSLVDQLAEAKLKTSSNRGERALLRSVMGKVAIANAKITYQRYKELYSDARWKAMAGKNPQTQRLLWASTSTKNPNYRDVIYVEELIGADTVNTIPPATFDAFRDHGKCRPSLEQGLDDAHDTMGGLDQVGISFQAVTDQLLDEGIKVFNEAFDKLLSVVEKKRKVSKSSIVARQTYKLPEAAAGQLKAAVQDWRNNSKVRRLWARDATLWTGTDESNWLGWLGITEEQLGNISHLTSVAEEIRSAGTFSHCLLLGMGGSSLCPEVMKMTFGKIDGYPELHVLDSTDPAQLKVFESKIDYAKTIFIVSSKSGTTLEPNIFKQYFFERAKAVLGPERAPEHFIAVTDPRSKMERVAGCDGFRHIFFGLSSIGGRYSALSDFGMVPSAVMGLDVKRILERADEMAHACSSSVPVEENPGVMLGLIMGTLARQGRDKVTIITSPKIWDLGAWLEQLLAESTGKEGKGLIPVDQEKVGPPEAYGNDRLFCYLRLDGDQPTNDAGVDALEKAGHPVVRIQVPDIYDVSAEFFRWEIATAVAGSVIGINAFNQPDVEASKVATRKLTTEYEKNGSLPAESPVLEADGIKLYTDETNAAAIAKAAGNDKSLAGYLKAHFDRVKAGDYVAVLGYVEMNDAHTQELQAMRHAVRDKKKVATCLGFGPRFLHSTGQAYKGGPNSGVFLQITCDDAADVPVPGQTYTFGVVKAAQARGDFAVLAERGRRALRVHLGKDVKAGLTTLRKAVEKVL